MKKLALFAVALLFLTGAGCTISETSETEQIEIVPIENTAPEAVEPVGIPLTGNGAKVEASVTIE